MNSMIVNFLNAISLLGYAFIVIRMIYFVVYIYPKKSFLSYLRSPVNASMSYFAIIIHIIYIWSVSIKTQAIDMGLLNMLTATFWFMFLVVRLYAIKYFSPLMFFIIACINMVILVVDLLSPKHMPILVSDYAIGLHAGISVLAYSLCGLVIAQASIFSLQEKALRIHHSWFWLHWLPSLEQNEKLFYDLSRLAFIGLSVSILSGMFVLNDWLAQHVAHKTVFTLLAWLIFGVLLLLKKRYVLMPQQSANWAVGACLLLIIGVVGSKIVLEFIL